MTWEIMYVAIRREFPQTASKELIRHIPELPYLVYAIFTILTVFASICFYTDWAKWLRLLICASGNSLDGRSAPGIGYCRIYPQGRAP